MIRLFIYPIIQTRADIYYTISILSQFNYNLNAKHFGAAKRILRYLKGTINIGITYGGSGRDGLKAFTDAD